MACFDYEEVECSRCHRMTIDEYSIIKDKVVCGSCIEGELNECETKEEYENKLKEFNNEKEI